MKKIIFFLLISFLFFSNNIYAATQQNIKLSIDKGLAHLANTMTKSGDQGYWYYSDYGTLATTAAASLAFVEAGYLPGTNVVIDEVDYGDIVGMACNYIFNRASIDSRFTAVGPGGMETAVYTRYAEDYNSDGILNDGGNNQAIYFEPGYYSRRLYTTGIVTPLVYALGEALGPDTTIQMGNITSSMTYKEVLRDIIDWFSWGQVEPDRGNQRGGWRYDANWPDSDNSTAQWPALAMIYGKNWGLTVPKYVKDELKLWTDFIQNDNGGCGYHDDTTYVNVSKTGGLLLQFFALGYEIGKNNSDSPHNNITNEVDAALAFISSRWNTTPYSTWYGNLNHPYSMWAVYKALQIYGFLEKTNYYPGDDSEFIIGKGMDSAPGEFVIGQDWQTYTSVQGDWYSHYCNYLVSIQNENGSWTGYSYWTGALATGWYINILKATPVTPTINPTPQNVRIIVGKNTAILSWTCDNLSEFVNFEVKYRIKDSGDDYQYLLDENNNPMGFKLTNAVIQNLKPGNNYEFIIETVLYVGLDLIKIYPSEPVYGLIPKEVADLKLTHPLLLIPGTGGGAESWNKKIYDDMKKRLVAVGIKYGGTLDLEKNDESNRLKTNWKWGAPESIGDFYIGEYNEVKGLFHPCGDLSENYTPTKLFIDEIRRIEKKINSQERNFILTGQSLGGLRARAYLQKKDRDENDQDFKNKVAGLITIGTPNLGVLQDHAKYDEKDDIYGTWRIIMGNAKEDENDFFDWGWGDDDYKFVGGYINDTDRYKLREEKNNKLYVQRLMEHLRDGQIHTTGDWDFSQRGLKEDIVAGSVFFNSLNFWIESFCEDGESKDCNFFIKNGCENGECEDRNNKFNHLPNIYYRYVIGKNPEGSPHRLVRDWQWYNYFMFKNQYKGDGFISELSQNFSDYHLSINNRYVDYIDRPGQNHQSELLDHIGLLEAIGFKVLKIIVKCPVELSVESPSGLIQAKSIAEILGATYNEADIDGDGNLDRFIEIPFPEQGKYKITLTPIAGADLNQTYTLEVEHDGVVTIILEDEPIGNLNGIPVILDINVSPMANAGPDQKVNAQANGIALVTLDGSGSSDSGSTPGTNDHIVDFSWYENGILLGQGEIIQIPLGLGEHDITLFVTDIDGATDEDNLLITVTESEYMHVKIDILPGSCTNPLNVKSRGMLPITIIGTSVFDVTQIDPGSITLEGVNHSLWAIEDVTSSSNTCDEVDYPDGYLDLNLKFDGKQVAAALGLVKDKEQKILTVRGNLFQEFGGTSIYGEDTVVILKK